MRMMVAVELTWDDVFVAERRRSIRNAIATLVLHRADEVIK